jgi:hypothetical protein
MKKSQVKWVQDFKKICPNCEFSNRSGERFYCEWDEEHQVRVGLNKEGCKHFVLDYNLDAKSYHKFTGEKRIVC